MEVHFPPLAKAAHPRVWAFRLCVVEYREDPRTPSERLSISNAHLLATMSTSKIFEALEQDLYPSNDVESIFGIQMNNALGGLVRNTWARLFVHDLITAESVKAALLHGVLPSFFEQKVRELEKKAPHDGYASRLRAAAGRGLMLIDWDVSVLVEVSRAVNNQ